MRFELSGPGNMRYSIDEEKANIIHKSSGSGESGATEIALIKKRLPGGFGLQTVPLTASLSLSMANYETEKVSNAQYP